MLPFYVEVARTAFRRQLIYRWANLAGLLANTFFGIIFSYVIIALFQARHVAAGYTVTDTLRYIWLTQALIMVVSPFRYLDLMLTIRSGAVISDLSKPCDFYWYWFSRECGRSLYYVFFRGIPTYVMGMLLFGFGFPVGWQAILLFAFSLALASIIGIAYRYLYNIAAFWIVEARAVSTLAVTIALVFAGNYIPLAFFPSWLQAMTNWLPFNGFMNVPIEILLGKILGSDLLFELGRQALWVVVATIGVRMITVVATRRVVVQGG